MDSFVLILLAPSLLLFFKLIDSFIHPARSPLNILPGPPSPHWLFGWFFAERRQDVVSLTTEWIEKYGRNIRTTTLFRKNRLVTVDFRALNHILMHSADYTKPRLLSNQLWLFKNGILLAEGDRHRQQRRVMNPAFGPAQIRGLTDIFVEKAFKLRDVWETQLAEMCNGATINVAEGLSRMTLDVIGLAGFGYDFNSLDSNDTPCELKQALTTVISAPITTRLEVLQVFFPILRIIPTDRIRRVKHASEVMRRLGMQLVQEKKAAVMASISSKKGVTTSDVHDRDLLSLLIKANMSSDIPAHQRMSDEDVLAQVPTFLIAGHETTSSAVTWCLFDLARAPRVQSLLRQELLSVPTESPSMETLDDLPYLEWVIKETLRLHGPVPMSARTAEKDDVIPLSEPFVDKNGEVRDHIRIAKGDEIRIPIAVINTWKVIWGENALEYRPERWESPPEGLKNSPGIWSHMLNFLGGTRACIGYRFSLVEMKALLFALVRSFEFTTSLTAEDFIIKQPAVVARPMLKSDLRKGVQMPLILKPFKSD